VLEQKFHGQWQPLGFFSKKLSPAEQRYSTYDGELLAAFLDTRRSAQTTGRSRSRSLSRRKQLSIDGCVKFRFYSNFFTTSNTSTVRTTSSPMLYRGSKSPKQPSELGTGLGDLRQWSLDQTAGPQLQHMIADGVTTLLHARRSPVFRLLDRQRAFVRTGDAPTARVQRVARSSSRWFPRNTSPHQVTILLDGH